MLLLTYSYVVPKEKRTEHARLLNRMRAVMARLGCEQFEAFEQVGKGWVGTEATGRVVQIIRFRDKQHFQAVQAGEKSDPGAQQLIAEFCELINLPYQQQTGMFADGFYNELPVAASAGLGWSPPVATAIPVVAAIVTQPETHPEPSETPVEPTGESADHLQAGDSPDELVSAEQLEPISEDLATSETAHEPESASVESELEVETIDSADDLADIARLAPEGEDSEPAARNGEGDVMDFLNDSSAEDAPDQSRDRADS